MVRGVTRVVFDLLYPPRCSVCSCAVEATATCCADCFGRLRFLGHPACDRCGHPLPYAGPGDVCAACLNSAPPYLAARAALRYDETSRRLLTRLKYGDRHALLPLLSGWLAQAGEEIAQRSDLVLPVPLHWRRHVMRRFNQSELLAARFAAVHGLAFEPRALVRRKATRPQVGLSRAERVRNVAGAFAVRRPGRLKGRRLLVVDDVMTSGSTLEAITRTLLRAGAAEVRLLTVARRVLAEYGTSTAEDDGDD